MISYYPRPLWPIIPFAFITLYSVDLEVWSKLAKRARIMRIASKWVRDFNCDWQHVNAFSHCICLTRILLPQIISYSDTEVPVLVVMEYKHVSAGYVYELIYLLHTSKSTEYSYDWHLGLNLHTQLNESCIYHVSKYCNVVAHHS